MFDISKDNIIRITRGDSASFGITVMDGTTEYELQEGDVLRFTVRRNIYSTTKSLQKILGYGDTMEFVIEPEDTVGLNFGNYVYDVELTLADGTVNTIIPPSTFKVMGEVTYGV